MSGETSSQTTPLFPSTAVFVWGCLLEGALLIAAFGLARLAGVPFLATLRWNVMDALLGVAASVPLLALFLWLMRTAWPPVSGITRFLEEVVRPVIGGWSLWQMAVISLLAGVCEEILFRGVLQGGLALHWGTGPALIVASLVFGLAHCVNPAYAVVAAAIGAGFGGLWLWNGNLLVPIVAHAIYDFVALTWLARIRPPRAPT
jgi:hypothetical protein